MPPLRVVALALALWLGPAAQGVIVGPGDGAGTRVAPADDPGFAHVGQRGELTAIYLGRGWMLTAAHVTPGDVLVAGVSCSFAPGSHLPLARPAPTASPPDLALFRVDPSPALPPLALASRAPAVGSEVVMVGFGRDRGEAVRWRGIRGFAWAPHHVMRWGTNQVHESGLEVETQGFRTRAFSTQFNAFGTAHEAQASHGDSGGAVFARGSQGWELAGILLSITQYEGQPGSSALYGNLTVAADLSAYRAEILARLAAPPPPPLPPARDPPAPPGGDQGPAGAPVKSPAR